MKIMADYEKLGLFYLGRTYDLDRKARGDDLVLYDSRDLVTHAVCVGITGSGKTGLCLDLLEEAAIDGIPAIAIDPKGDLGNLLLTFPDLRPADFRPWINEEDARRKGLDPDAFAAAEADRWAKGLADWGQGGSRIRRLRQSADMVIYTPGSQAGIPVSVLESFAPPPAAMLDDPDFLRERVSTTATSLLGLAGIDADPIKSREHILLSTLLDTAWRAGRGLDIGALIQQIQSPPVTRIGVLEIEAFYPAKERFELAMALNNLLAAPGFASWMEGEPLDLRRLLYTPEGKPRVAILSIAHLSDAERMFFVSLLLNQTVGWMRSLAGTTSLRAIVYMDEIFGFLPPTANPPSKTPMLTLLKQARAFGVGMVLATQNPVDLDYKALSNAGTWLIGRLQTERDQMRVLDGLEGAIAAGGGRFDRQAMGRVLAGLGSRVFLMHDVHEDGPQVFESRWAMSYLRGPLTRAQIKTLMDPRRQELAASRSVPSRATPASAGGTSGAQPQISASAAPPGAAAATPSPHVVSAAPVLPPEIPQFFAPSTGSATFEPMLLGVADVRFTDSKMQVDETRTVAFVTPIASDAVAVDWGAAEEAGFDVRDLTRQPPAGATFLDLPAAAQTPRSYAAWTKAFTAWLTREQRLDLLRSDTGDLVARPGEREGEFRVRVSQAAREARDEAVSAVRRKYAPRVAALNERLRRAQQAVSAQQEQASASKMQTAISFGSTVLGAVFGRKTLSLSTLGRATTAARGVGRSMKEQQDVARAEESVAAFQTQLQEIETSLQADIAAIEASHASGAEPLDRTTIKPRRGGIHVQLVALTWVPLHDAHS